MNAIELKQLLLLEQSGELTPKQRHLLDQELAASDKARRLRAELRRLAQAISAPVSPPAPNAAARIAARLRQTPRPAFTVLPAWKPALAAAAACALLIGVRTFQRGNPDVPPEPARAAAAAEEADWTDPLDAEFTELESLLLAISSEDSFEITEL